MADGEPGAGAVIAQVGTSALAFAAILAFMFFPWWTLDIETTTGRGTTNKLHEARPFDQGAFALQNGNDLRDEVRSAGNLYLLSLVGVVGMGTLAFLRGRGLELSAFWSLGLVLVSAGTGLAATLFAMNEWPGGHEVTAVRGMTFWDSSTSGIPGGQVTHTTEGTWAWWAAMGATTVLPLVPMVLAFIFARRDNTPTL